MLAAKLKKLACNWSEMGAESSFKEPFLFLFFYISNQVSSYFSCLSRNFTCLPISMRVRMLLIGSLICGAGQSAFRALIFTSTLAHFKSLVVLLLPRFPCIFKLHLCIYFFLGYCAAGIGNICPPPCKSWLMQSAVKCQHLSPGLYQTPATAGVHREHVCVFYGLHFFFTFSLE